MDKTPESDVAPAASDVKSEPIIDTAATSAPAVEAVAAAPHVEAPEVQAPAAPANEAAGNGRWHAMRSHRYAPLAASVAVALILGGALGSAATVFSSVPAPAPAPVVDHTVANETRALKETVVRLSTELATFKASLDSGHRAATTQFNKIADRMDRVEKAQAEPAAKLAKIADAVDRLERRPSSTALAAAASSDITNSIPAPAKPATKPATLEGWALMEFGSGRAVVENRNGQLFEVGPGSNLPGVGKIESIKREDGRVVVATPKGIIVSSAEPRRRPAPYYDGPYRRY
jgi:hypothetical protein